MDNDLENEFLQKVAKLGTCSAHGIHELKVMKLNIQNAKNKKTCFIGSGLREA